MSGLCAHLRVLWVPEERLKCRLEEDLMAAALRRGLRLPLGCRSGVGVRARCWDEALPAPIPPGRTGSGWLRSGLRAELCVPGWPWARLRGARPKLSLGGFPTKTRQGRLFLLNCWALVAGATIYRCLLLNGKTFLLLKLQIFIACVFLFLCRCCCYIIFLLLTLL